MASSMELEKDRSFDSLVDVVIPGSSRNSIPSCSTSAAGVSVEIDRELAERGRRLFYSKSVGCSRCHGVYDGRGNVDWPGVHKNVGTDPRGATSCPMASARRSRRARWLPKALS